MESQDSSISSGSPLRNRRLKRACEYVGKLWFPVNPEVLEKVREGLSTGAYQLDIDFLLDDLKSDFALYTHCLRELSERYKAEVGEEHRRSLTPSDLIHWAGPDRIAMVVNDTRLDSSPHDLASMNEEQRARLHEALLSASVAETLSEAKNVDADLGFSVSLLRQLGLMLISWNYPQVYEKVMQNLNTGDDLEFIFSQALGFSPSLLAVTVIGDWGLAPDIVRAIHVEKGDAIDDDSAIRKEARQLSEELHQICEVGEALARANDPDRYPEAERDWLSAKDEIHKVLGERGLKLIQQTVTKNADSYLSFDKKGFQSLNSLNPVLKIRQAKERRLRTSNPYIQKCGPRLKRLLENLYEKITPGVINVECIKELVNDIIPAVGFSGGCVYIIDPAVGMLVPRIKIGKMLLEEYKPVTYSLSGLESSQIRNAFHAKEPLIDTGYRPEEGNIAYIAEVLGHQKKAGVVYLEVSDVSFYPNDTLIRAHFRAIKETLADCLNLN